ncbi:DUF4249 domain-containing protein [Dyadobacter sp. CY261]|uniref:DUF4249 domain-containing protein n=1 Tax=Dyadobacter sp. CY261 TaxID=2907203 RepID=UPI001F2B4B2F|nr:DUF4249 domain-containing protein [Dyadobacter sp. CY261]MCF0070972.1 DUF4249 domain-containing protein [Dyadobacter sp. CY261]
MKASYKLFFLLMVMNIACETLVTDIPESRLPHAESKLVVHSFISPQAERITVVVSESQPLFPQSDVTDRVIENAVVTISDGTGEVVLPFDELTRMYSIDQSKFPIKASKTYHLIVSAGVRNVTAQCTVPKNIPVIKSYVLDKVVSPNAFFGNDEAITLKMDWTDISGETNYYRVRAEADIEYSIPDPKSQEKRIRNDFNFNWDEMTGRAELQTDQNRDGMLFSSPLGKVTLPNFTSVIPESTTQQPFDPKSRVISVIMMIYNTDIHYHKYHKSMQVHIDADNPFSEPTTVYTNIQGGLGCFGAYNLGKLTYQPD